MVEPTRGAATTLAVLLRTWRERALLTQAELARRAGLGVRTIRRIESGSLLRPRTHSVRLLADALELTAGERTQLVAAASATAPLPALWQLPAPPWMFTGRTAELADLDRVGDPSTVAVVAIDGMAGVGKSALAIHAAHRLAPRFRDGQLFLNLHGHTPGVAPVSPVDAAAWMLRAIGVPDAQIPPELDQRAALLRSVLAGRRMLVLLDSAATEAQVRPLLPGTAGCLVLVTSRRRLTGLDTALRISLDLLPAADAGNLFTRTSGTSPPPDVVAEIVELCGRLPLAIRIAAARLQNNPTWTPAHLADRLRDHRHRLAELDAGDRSVTAAIDLSYQDLTADRQRAFRVLSLHPGADLDSDAAVALTGTSPELTDRLLDDLAVAHLLTEHALGRYRFHDLVRAHAAAAADRDDPEPDRHAALGRLFDHYVHAAAFAMDLVYPHEADRRPPLPPPPTATPRWADPAEAARWLDAELANLLATADQATTHGRPDHTVALSTILYRHLRVRGESGRAHRLHRHAVAAARAVGDRTGELNALINLGDTMAVRGELEPADDYLGHALAIARDLGHIDGEVAALLGLGAIAYYQARHDLATDRLEQLLAIARAARHTRGELRALGNLGNIHRLHGRVDAATNCYWRALTIARAIGDRNDELKALVGLGHIHRLQGQLDAAGDRYQEALVMTRAIGDRDAELQALWGVAAVHRALGRYPVAIACFDALLELAQRISNRNSEFEAHHGLGHAHRATGQPQRAISYHQRALQIARDLQQPDDQARAHDGLALAHHALGHGEAAGEHWHTALAILADLGLTHIEEVRADDIRANLSELRRRSIR